MNLRPAPLAALCGLALLASACRHADIPAPAAPEIASGYRSGLQAVRADRHMAAAANPLATAAGLEMLRQGGSAIDAAIAMQAVLTLVEPQSSGIGGGAFILYWDGKRAQAFDGRETAPQQASARQFLQRNGSPMRFADAQIGGLSVGVPGALRALELAHQQHGRLPWSTLFGPAITLARDGFPVSPRLHALIAADRFIAQAPAMARYFLTPDGQPLPIGTQLQNPQLAASLEAIANQGANALYQGPLAQAISAQVNAHANPGSLSLADLRGYRAKEREPVCAPYKQWQVCGMPAPSSGGVAVLQTLGILEALGKRDRQWDVASMPPHGPAPQAGAVHLVAEAERLAYADRAQYLADPDFVQVNVKGLLSPAYLASRAEQVGARSMGRADAGVPPGLNLALAPDRSPLRTSTSQVVAVDSFGGALSMTTSIEAAFGAHVMVGGFLLNNQLTDFSFVPEEHGKPVANRLEPGKRPRSSMAPTLVFERQSGQLVAALGSPGGSQIIQYVNKALIGVLDWKLDPQAAIDLPNFGSRNLATELEAGRAGPALRQQLQARGHNVTEIDMTSGTQMIMRDGDGWLGSADPRREGSAAGD